MRRAAKQLARERVRAVELGRADGSPSRQTVSEGKPRAIAAAASVPGCSTRGRARVAIGAVVLSDLAQMRTSCDESAADNGPLAAAEVPGRSDAGIVTNAVRSRSSSLRCFASQRRIPSPNGFARQ